MIDSSNISEYAACLRLRHSYFSISRKWVCESDAQQESDHYDSHCQHLAVFHNDYILTYLRLLPWQQSTGFMLDHDFRRLLPDGYELKRHNAVEISRLVVSESLNADEKIKAIELLFKLFYRVSLQNGYEHFFIVVEPGWLRMCRQRFGFRFSPISPIYTFPDGTRTIAGYASLSDLETSMRKYSLEKFQWYASADDGQSDNEKSVEGEKPVEAEWEERNENLAPQSKILNPPQCGADLDR